MTFWKSLRARLMLSYVGLIVVGFAGLALLAGRQIESSAVEDFQQSLTTQVSLVARGLAETLEGFREQQINQAALLQQVDGYATQLNARVLLVDPLGRPWLASDGNLPTENLATAPEIAAALQGRVASNTRADENGTSTFYVAAPIREEEHLLSVVRLDTPLSAARAAVARRWLALGGGVLIVAALAMLVSSLLAASLTRPLARLRTSVLQMAGGDLEQQLPEDREDEIGELAKAFNHMARQVNAMLEEQRAFASNASHELRTPLATIRLRSEALREGTVDAETARQYVAEIDDEVARLGGLVEDLILLSRLDSGRAQPGAQRVDAARLIHHLLGEYEATTRAKALTLTLDAPPNLPPLQASMNHLRVVLRNLLDNAVKYTPPGGSISWRLQREGSELHITVADTGQGIAAEDLAHLFERFYRADKARTRETGGVGLGLSLVQDVVYAYGGRISVTSPGVGQGTTIDVWWPLAEDATDFA